MESMSLVICDPEKNYAQSLAFYIMNRKGIHFQIRVCSDIRYVRDADILLISEIYLEEMEEQIHAKKVLVLSEGDADLCQEESIYKYQPGEQILEEVLKKSEVLFHWPQKKKRNLIGIFSPVHRIGKTTYALQLGEQLAANENVLYLNLELYGGIGGHFEKGEQTMEDVLYFARQGMGNLGFMITKMVKRRGNLDYILPAPVSEDIRKIPAREWIGLLEEIMEESIYETIILDLDEGIQDVYEILEICSQVHMLTDQTEYSQAKIDQFERELILLGHEDVLGKITRKEQPL